MHYNLITHNVVETHNNIAIQQYGNTTIQPYNNIVEQGGHTAVQYPSLVPWTVDYQLWTNPLFTAQIGEVLIESGNGFNTLKEIE